MGHEYSPRLFVRGKLFSESSNDGLWPLALRRPSHGERVAPAVAVQLFDTGEHFVELSYTPALRLEVSTVAKEGRRRRRRQSGLPEHSPDRLLRWRRRSS